jgi:hypothetical protein
MQPLEIYKNENKKGAQHCLLHDWTDRAEIISQCFHTKSNDCIGRTLTFFGRWRG